MAIDDSCLLQGAVTDYWLFTTMNVRRRREGCPKAVRSCRLVAAADFYICVWLDHADALWENEFDFEHDRRVTGPIPERSVRHGYRTKIYAEGGLNESARLIQDIMRHNEWGIGQVVDRVTDWQRRYFQEVVSKGLSAGNHEIDLLGRDLAAISGALGEARQCVRDLALRLEHGQVICEDGTREELMAECDDRATQMLAEVDNAISETRECFGLLAGGFASRQVDQQHSFQVAVSAIASLVLIPGLILSLYGANVDGLPGSREPLGLLVIGASSLIGCFATAAVLRFLNRQDWAMTAATIVLTVLAYVALIAFAETETASRIFT